MPVRTQIPLAESPGKRAAILRIAAALSLVAAAADPPAPWGARHRARVICIDRSASVERAPGFSVEGALDAGAAGLGAGDSICIIEFAGRARVIREWSPWTNRTILDPRQSPAAADELLPLETNITEATALAARMLAQRDEGAWAREVVLVSDGRATDAVATEFLQKQNAVALVAPPVAKAPNAAVVALELPAAAAAGARVAARAVVEASGAAPREVEFTIRGVSGAGAVQRERAPLVDSRGGRLEASCIFVMNRGESLQIEARAAATDRFPEDDRMARVLPLAGRLRVAFAGDAPEWLLQLRKITDLEWVEWNSAGVASLAGASTDVLILVDADRESLGARLPAIRDFIQNGGAVLFCGMRRGFVTSALEGTPLASLNPLRARDDDAKTDLLLLVDASGSMAGAKFQEARDAAILLASHAASGGRVRAAYFQQKMLPPFDATGEGARERWNAVEPRGATEEVEALRDAVRVFDNSKYTKKKIYFISDGLEKGGRSPLAPAVECGEFLVKNGVQILAFAVGEDADADFLSALTANGRNGRAVSVAQVKDLSVLLQNEWERDGLAPGGAVAAVAGAGVSVILQNAPPVESVARVEARPGAKVAAVLASGPGAGDPILAFGADGHAAAFASIPGPHAPGYLQFPEMWLSVLRAIAPSRGTPRAWIDGGLVRVDDPSAGEEGARVLQQNGRSVKLWRKSKFTFEGEGVIAPGPAELYASSGARVAAVCVDAGAIREALPSLPPLPLPGLDALPAPRGGRSMRAEWCILAVLLLTISALGARGGRARD